MVCNRLHHQMAYDQHVAGLVVTDWSPELCPVLPALIVRNVNRAKSRLSRGLDPRQNGTLDLVGRSMRWG